MSIAFQNTPFNQKVTIMDDQKYCLFGDPIEGTLPGKMPKLFFSIRGNYPHIRIFLNNGKSGNDGKIDLALDLLAYMCLVQQLEEVAKATQPVTQCIAIKQTRFDKETKKRSEPYIGAILAVGKNADGEVFLGVQRGKSPESKNYLRMLFHFAPPDFHPLLDADGNVLPRSRVSVIVAKAWVRLLTELIPLINVHVWDYATTPEGSWAIKRQAEQGGGNNNNGGGYTSRQNNGGGYNNNNSGGYNNRQENNSYSNNNSGGYSAPAEPAAEKSFDDDLPW